MRKILFLTAVLLLGLTTCTESDISVTGVELNYNTAALTVGETKTKIATVLPHNATNQNIAWRSHNSNVATVDENGVVTALSEGTAIITVITQDGARTATSTVTVVSQEQEQEVSVASVSLNITETTLTIGDTKELVATVEPYNATNQNVTWTSSNPDIATVDENGRVTAVAQGTATITVTTEDGNHTANSIVTVVCAITCEGVVINGVRWAKRNVDAPRTFAASPEDAGMFYQWNRHIGWSSTDPMVSSIGGTIWDSSTPAANAWYPQNDPCPSGWRIPTREELLSLGSGYWTNNWNDTGVSGRVFGIVTDQIFLPVAGFRDDVNGRLSYVGELGKYWSSTQYAADGAAQTLSFCSSIVGVGMHWIWRSRGFSVRCVAIEQGGGTVAVTDVSLNRTSTTLVVGGTETLTATISPANACNQNVTWTSSNPNIATVDANGQVTAVAQGTATITVTTQDGNHTANSTVTVNTPTVPVTGVTINRTTAMLVVGSFEILTATVLPENATNRNVTWTSSNTAIATVDTTTGVVTAVSPGTVAITVITEEGAHMAHTAVTVISPTDGAVINGVVWATRNVGSPGAFVQNPEDAGMLYQWNRRIGWSSIDPMVNSNGGTTFRADIPTGATWEAQNDPCPAGWRVPTEEELRSLSNAGNVWITQNGVNGRLFGASPHQIFLPAAGLRGNFYNAGGALRDAGTRGSYWSSNPYWSYLGWSLQFSSTHIHTSFTLRNSAYSVRCVAIEGGGIPGGGTVAITGVSLNRTSTTLVVGDRETLTATISPANATNQNVTWSSSNPNIATVDANGRVTAVSAGTATITVRTVDGGFTANSTVTVTVPPTTDVGVVINGVRWATRNVNAPGTFAQNPQDAGMFFQWGRNVGWSSTDPLVNSHGGTTWDTSHYTGTTWRLAVDPCPIGWRVPTMGELRSLGEGRWTTDWNGTGAIGRVFGTATDNIFLPAAGTRNHQNGNLFGSSEEAAYWSNNHFIAPWANRAAGWTFNAAGADPADWQTRLFRGEALSIRCVAE